MSKKVTAIKVRSLLSIDCDKIVFSFNTNAYVLFEDNKVVFMTAHEIVLLRFLLTVTQRYPKLKIVSEFNPALYYKNGMYVSKTINSVFEVMYRNIVEQEVMGKMSKTVLAETFKDMYIVINNVYNNIVYNNLDYVNSINITDFLDIQMKPKLIEALQKVNKEKTKESVENSYDILDTIIRTDKTLKTNKIAQAYIAGTVSPNQVKQMLAARGFVTEINSSIFKYPIASGYVLGLNNIYELSIESRSGAKALYLSNKAISESEYLAREIQLVTMSVEELVETDCGSKDYLDWYVKVDDTTGKSDLPNIVGKYYLNEETGKEELITHKDKHLEGKIVKLRSVFGCKIRDKQKVCERCFGIMSYNIPTHSNIGHICPTTVTQKVSQSILSTKHITQSADSSSVQLDESAKKYFVVKNKNGYGINPKIMNRVKNKLTLMVDQQYAFGIKDITSTVNVRKLNISRVSRIGHLTMSMEINSVPMVDAIVVKDGNRYGNFTYEFLEYIATNGYKLDDKDRYIIDMTGWKTTAPIMVIPQVEYNFLELAKNIKSIFKYTKVDKNNRSVKTPEALLQDIFDLVNSKLNINIALLEIMVYAYTVYDAENHNMDLGRNSKDIQLRRIEDILVNRSLGATYAWERLKNIIPHPGSFANRNRTNHLLDVFLKPNETILDYYKAVPNKRNYKTI